MFKCTIVLLLVSIQLNAKDLYEAIATVESNNNSNAIGDKGKAVGKYQIHKIYVDDVNSFAKANYTYEDRKNPTKSLEMVKIYLNKYSKRYERITGKIATNEIKARIHNGGPNGWKNPKTLNYWNKVKKEIEK